MFRFPAHFAPDPDGGFTVTFRDIPEAITQGDNLEDAKAMAVDALVTAMDFYFEEGRTVPNPSELVDEEMIVELPPSIGAKVSLLNLVIEKRQRPVDLAKAMGVKPQEVTRILDLHHATKIDTLADAFKALGHNLEVTIKPRIAELA
jgi:antitoxin HicB